MISKKELIVNLWVLLFTLTVVFSFTLLTSCSVQRETGKRIYNVEFQSPVKVKTLNKCSNESN